MEKYNYLKTNIKGKNYATQAIKQAVQRTVRIIFLGSVLFESFLTDLSAQIIVLENDTLGVKVETSNGCFSVTEKISGQEWKPDPWEHAAGLLTLMNPAGVVETLNISKCLNIEVVPVNKNTVSLKFTNPIFPNGTATEGIIIETEINLDPLKAILVIKITEYKSAAYKLVELRYPARPFSLRTDIDKGAGVIPQWQGIICPSYIFPMTGGRFCQWDDALFDKRSIGTLKMYNFSGGLSMPWFGTHTDKSAVVGILNENPKAEMDYIINNNGQYLFNSQGKMSPYPRILALSPVWKLDQPNIPHQINYYFIVGGNHVQMAKKYRETAIKRGYFLSLRDKAKQNPDVEKLAGAVYLGIYGGYPHYVNMPGMAFTFERLKEIIKDTHEGLKVERAFIHAWGTFSNYVPVNWPISEVLGGPAKLKEAVDLAKEYGWLYSSYHAYSPALEHDPDFNINLLPKNKNGQLFIGSRWSRVESKNFLELAKAGLPREMKAIGQNADVTDILFISTPDQGRLDLAKYLRSLGMVMGTERGQEHWIPYFDFFEGMTYYYCSLEGVPLSTISQKAPLFNLVYHDAIANFGKIQDPDNDITFNGDFRTKSLRNILIGNGSMIFFAPYEYEGLRDMIKMANNLVAPIHRETFFEELTDHEYLSADFQVQRSRFSNGSEVIVNLGPVEQIIDNDTKIPAYGYKITNKNGEIKRGCFSLNLYSN